MGPGRLGNVCIREVLRLPSFDLVGVLAYWPEKNGADAATMIGSDGPVGVTATTSLERADSIDTYVVIDQACDSDAATPPRHHPRQPMIAADNDAGHARPRGTEG